MTTSALSPFSRQYSCAWRICRTSARSASATTRTSRTGRSPEMPCAQSPSWPRVLRARSSGPGRSEASAYSTREARRSNRRASSLEMPRWCSRLRACANARAHALAQAHHRIEQDASRPGERAPVERLRILGAPATAEEAAAVALPLDRSLRPGLLPDDVHREDLGVVRGARSPPAEQRVALRDVLGLDEELAERGVGEVVRARREDDLGVARDLELADPAPVVRHLEAPHLDVVLG